MKFKIYHWNYVMNGNDFYHDHYLMKPRWWEGGGYFQL